MENKENQENQQQGNRNIGGVDCKQSSVSKYFDKVTKELDTWVEDDGDKRAYILMVYEEVGRKNLDEENERIACDSMFSANGKVGNARQLIRRLFEEEKSPVKKVILSEAARNITEGFFNQVRKMAGK